MLIGELVLIFFRRKSGGGREEGREGGRDIERERQRRYFFGWFLYPRALSDCNIVIISKTDAIYYVLTPQAMLRTQSNKSSLKKKRLRTNNFVRVAVLVE